MFIVRPTTIAPQINAEIRSNDVEIQINVTLKMEKMIFISYIFAMGSFLYH